MNKRKPRLQWYSIVDLTMSTFIKEAVLSHPSANMFKANPYAPGMRTIRSQTRNIRKRNTPGRPGAQCSAVRVKLLGRPS